MDNTMLLESPQGQFDSVDGIEIIVEAAKSGKVDPWNIDIVQLTDLFLEKLIEIKQSNLRLTGRTLFFAAVLLRLKSNYLEGLDPFAEENPEEPEEDFYEEDFENEDYQDMQAQAKVVELEKALARRTSVRINRSRKVTLGDLIKQLRKLEAIDSNKRRKKAEESVKNRRSYTHFTPDDILEMAHEEFIESEIIKLQGTLTRLFESDERVEFNEILETGMNRVSAYIALLFLTSRGRIDLVQDDFYSDLYIVKEVV